MRDDGGQHLLKVERGADRLADLGERPLLLHRARKLGRTLLQLLEEAGVLDGDDGLVREGLQQRDLLIAERLDLVPVHRHDADRSPMSEERHVDHGPEPDS